MDEPTILVVDDEQTLADLYATWLGEEYETETAYGGAQALSMIDEATDIVLLDRRMPDWSGDEVLDELRMQGYDCWVVMVTAVDPGLDLIELDVHDYLTKPVSETTLVRLVESLLVKDRFDCEQVAADEAANKLAALEASLDVDDIVTAADDDPSGRLETPHAERTAEADEAARRLTELYSDDPANRS
ncbi:response regulator transcription factor [Haloarchaeobius sp. TZWWS8]|uniref:response regulator transcription factor n=1 Tax=Haloarchaeobius sp. TZWWS8 TaxID=3446121 RepID=UPI003EB77436